MNTARKFQSISPIDASTDELVTRMDAAGVPRQPTTTHAPAAPAKSTEPLKKVSLQIPEYLWDQLHEAARKQRCSMRHVIMKAIAKEGFTIEAADMVEDGRKNRS